MTNEKAIKHLEVIKGDCALVGDIRALDMAISVLSTEGEYIKKADILNELGDVNMDILTDEVKEIVNSLPSYSFPDSAENKGEWIPVSERLPEIHQVVLLSLRSLDIEVGFRAETEPYFYCHGVDGCYVEPQNVLAWMSLPEAYKTESYVRKQRESEPNE